MFLRQVLEAQDQDSKSSVYVRKLMKFVLILLLDSSIVVDKFLYVELCCYEKEKSLILFLFGYVLVLEYSRLFARSSFDYLYEKLKWFSLYLPVSLNRRKIKIHNCGEKLF